jgi:hypothetical protein
VTLSREGILVAFPDCRLRWDSTDREVEANSNELHAGIVPLFVFLARGFVPAARS